MANKEETTLISEYTPEQVTWPELRLQIAASGYERPVHVTHAGDGSGRLFIVEQTGQIRIIKAGIHYDLPFLSIADRVLYGGEQGLLSVAFPPGYGSGKNYFYVYYTNLNGDNRVSRFHFNRDPNVADPASEELILYLEHPDHGNHNGGQLAFGPDGYLYIGTGDGGGTGDPGENAQDLTSEQGKLLRIDVEGGVAPYAIPADNPFVGNPSYLGGIWAYGLRNPWRFGFDRLSGDLYIGDVGQGQIEEIDYQPATSPGGENYGWDVLEGSNCYEPPSGCTPPAGYVAPIAEYSHTQGDAVTGGTVYRGATFPRMQGIYFYADAESGRIWGLQNDGATWENLLLLETGLVYGLVSFGESESGELYAADLSGTIYRLADRIVAEPNFEVYLPLALR